MNTYKHNIHTYTYINDWQVKRVQIYSDLYVPVNVLEAEQKKEKSFKLEVMWFIFRKKAF